MHGLVLTAAGASKRFGGSASKVLLDLAGKPVLRHALDTFREAIPELAVVITARAADLARVRDLAGDAQVVVGGETRQASVHAGVRALPDEAEVILVHDAARPLVRAADVRTVLEAARTHGAAIAAALVTDTIHEAGAANADGTRPLLRLQDRSRLLAAQTPQAAQAPVLRAALDRAVADGFEGTDEAAVLRHAGVDVVACPFLPTNLKITTPMDLDLARRILARED
ncbi:MAG: 2-C-methyl-D-erythritol 4-phosphate cytidylyltransferase [Planctomycetota bacterium]|nr:2-C-methyl-D-erythritol 4-phosphate cytidylyltransferase [Planctomycetota bacterium]